MGFTLLRCVIGRENSRFFLNQSDAKLKPVTIWSPAFCRALVELFLLWFVIDSKVFPCFWLADVIGLVWVIRHSIKKHFMYMLWSLEFEAYLKPLTTWRVIFVSALTFTIFFIQMNSQIFFFRFFLATPMLGKIFGVIWKIIYTLLHHNLLTLRNNELVSSPLAFYIIQQTV